MKTKNSSEKYLNFLLAISQRQRGFRDIRKIISKFRISMSIQKILNDKVLIVKDDNGIWKWTGRTPDLKMAEQILNAVNVYVKSGHQEPLQKQNSQEQEDKIIKRKKKDSSKTEDRYLKVLQEVSKRKRGAKSLNRMFDKFKISRAIATAVHRMNLVENKNGVWKWIGGEPDSLMAGMVLHEVNKSIQESAAKSIAKKNKPKSIKTFFKSRGLKVDKVIVHKYVPASNGNGNGKDVLDLAKLRAERSELQNRISKINSILEVVDAFQEN